MMQKNMLSVSIDKEYDVFRKEYNDSIYLRLYTNLFKSTIIKDLKPTTFTVLLAISSFMDSKGNCFPTQRQISEITGISLPTINKSIATLLEYRINDLPLIRREFVQKGQFKNSYYTIMPISQIAIFDGLVKEIDTEKVATPVKENDVPVKETSEDVLKKLALNNNQLTITNNYNQLSNTADADEVTFKNSLEVAKYFAEEYEKQYSTSYTINFGRDVGLIKSKLFGKFTDKELKMMVDYTLSEYESRWKNPKFPRPTIGSMVSWIGQEALAVGKDKEKEDIQIDNLEEESADINASALAKFGVK